MLEKGLPNASPKVSVIIPTHNRAHFLAAAIQSVLRQEFRDFELLIVDDGSTDHTKQVVQSFNDSRLFYFYQENKGVSAAVNHGIRCARGDYIARLDSDDVWLPEMLSLSVTALDTQPEIGLVYGRAQGMDEHGNLRNDFRGKPEWFPGEAFRSMLYEDFTCNITVMVRRVCFDRAGLFDESLPITEDWDMWLRVAQHYRFAFLDQVVARYRYHRGNITSMSSKYLTELFECRRRVLDKVFAQTNLTPALLQMKPIAYFNLYAALGCCWLRHKNYRRAFTCFVQAVRARNYSLLAFVKIFWGAFVCAVLLRWQWGVALSARIRQWGRHV